MKNLTATLIIGATIALALPAQAQHHRLSPHATVSGRVDGTRIMIVYGRPYTTKPGTTKARKIWGGLVPYGKPWRMGADEATTLITNEPLEIGGATVPKGAYTLYMVPEENGPSKLAISTRIGQWGIPVNQSHDLARVDLKKSTLEKPVHQFTIAIEGGSSGGSVLKMMWEHTEFSVPITVKK